MASVFVRGEIYLVAIVVLASRVFCFPDGAPIETCIQNNFPNHPGTVPSSPSSFPFAFTASHSHYHPGSVIDVVIDGPPFKGFFVQAREAGHSGKSLGHFVAVPHTKTHDECAGVTHTDSDLKDKVVLQWKAPQHGSGEVVFLSTIVIKYDVYWSNIIAKTPVTSPNHF